MDLRGFRPKPRWKPILNLAGRKPLARSIVTCPTTLSTRRSSRRHNRTKGDTTCVRPAAPTPDVRTLYTGETVGNPKLT